ncbi:hypothetical protein Pelo_19642 [Pelomyxa schiedti]|nr:hypothetical protein Pelo_19642 [Pelomyxa schiedti]
MSQFANAMGAKARAPSWGAWAWDWDWDWAEALRASLADCRATDNGVAAPSPPSPINRLILRTDDCYTKSQSSVKKKRRQNSEP